MAEPGERRAERLEVRRRTPTDTSDIGRAYGLSAEVADTAVRRLGFLALAVALLLPAGYWVETHVQAGRTGAVGSLPFWIQNIFFPVAGLAVCALAWSRKFRSDLVLDIGLVFQVVAALALSLTENTPAWPEGQWLRGASWNSLWITVYVITIPGALGKTALSAVTAACMGPLGLLIAYVIHPAAIHGPQILNELIPFAAAGWSIPIARNFYHLRVQVSRARAMGSYELLERIGEGGMGEVWTARHRMLTRVSAIKLIRPEALAAALREDSQMLQRRFEREARATAALRSPHTVALYDYGTTEDGNFYYVMELLEGFDLETLVQRFGPLPAGRVVWLLSQVAKSLAEAHEMGLVHRDIKPRNVFACRVAMEYDFAKVLDFGLVKVAALENAETVLTREGVTTGTPAYMAPEIARALPGVDGRADLYSLGCVGYWLLTGQLVFQAETAVGMALAHVQERAAPPSSRTEIEVPEALDQLILRCLEKDPAARPESALRLVELLAECKGAEPWTQKEAEQWWRTHLPDKSQDRKTKSAASGSETV